MLMPEAFWAVVLRLHMLIGLFTTSLLCNMDISTQIQGSHATASPSGQYLALISNGKLRICAAHAPERCTEVAVRVAAKDISALKWNDYSTSVVILSAQNIEIVDLDDVSHRVRLNNGSAGLGRLVSADFVGSDQLLVSWEFGKAKLWNLSNGKGVELGDLKTVCSGERWQIRPGDGDAARRTLATLSRPGADDLLNLYFPALHKQLASVKLPTTDAQSLCWSPDGRWLAVLDSAIASPSLHFYTPDGHHFRSYPPPDESNELALRTKAMVWSPDSQVIALSSHDGKITLLNTRTFTPLAIIEHSTTIDQRTLSSEQQAPIWQEVVLASSERSYIAAPQPVSPPLSKTKSSAGPNELGVAEARFSCDGTYLATRDERMLNTVWIWNMATLATHAVVIQHSNVRRLHWHPTRPDTLMLECGEGIVYLYQASSTQAPLPLSTSTPASAALSWLDTCTNSKPAILVTSKSSFRIIYPEGQPESSDFDDEQAHSHAGADETFDEGASEDSLFDVLSGRTPLPPKTEQSYTERIDVEVETEEEDSSTRMDDTFREKRTRRPVPVDPFDDSQIF